MFTHGTLNGYQHHKCRCDECKNAGKERRNRKWAKHIITVNDNTLDTLCSASKRSTVYKIYVEPNMIKGDLLLININDITCKKCLLIYKVNYDIPSNR